LYEQLESVEMEIFDDCSTFDLDIDHKVSAHTAKEMSKLDLNYCSFHRKFDGRLKMIDFKFRRKDDDDKKMCKIFDMIGLCGIDEYISDEDVDTEDIDSNPSDSEDSDSGSDGSGTDESYSSSDSPVRKLKGNIPKGLLTKDVPRFAKKAQKNRKH